VYGEVIAIGSLFLEEFCHLLGTGFSLGNTWESNELNKSVNVVVETLRERFRPR
jgi:hypothetical protein